MELLTYLGYTAFGPFLGGMMANILSNRADSGLKQMEAILAAKLHDGRLPVNHDLQQAVLDALRQALRGLALALAASHHPASPFLQALRRQLLNPQDRKLPVTTLLDVPFWTSLDSAERNWIDAFSRCIEDTDALARLASLGLAAEGGVDALLEETPTDRRGELLRLAVTEWLDIELHGLPGRPSMLDEYLEQGWPVADYAVEIKHPIVGAGHARDHQEFSAEAQAIRQGLSHVPNHQRQMGINRGHGPLLQIPEHSAQERLTSLPIGQGLKSMAMPLSDDKHRITLFQAWCWFFREAVKDRPKVFNIYVAETLVEIKRQLSATRPELAPSWPRPWRNCRRPTWKVSANFSPLNLAI